MIDFDQPGLLHPYTGCSWLQTPGMAQAEVVAEAGRNPYEHNSWVKCNMELKKYSYECSSTWNYLHSVYTIFIVDSPALIKICFKFLIPKYMYISDLCAAYLVPVTGSFTLHMAISRVGIGAYDPYIPAVLPYNCNNISLLPLDALALL